jgi:hypothetical protein
MQMQTQTMPFARSEICASGERGLLPPPLAGVGRG